MQFLAYLAFFGWFFFSLYVFDRRNPQKSVLIIILGSWLFLPEITIPVNVLPDLSKFTISGVSLLFCLYLFDYKSLRRFSFTKLDLPIMVFCFVPIFTSLSNNLGIWDGLSSSINQFLTWAVPYFVARIYFNDLEKLKFLLVGVAFSALIYIPFVWFEIVMSPRLHQIIYGINQSDWLEHVRYGGWRPKVFLQHGLMVSLFMAVSTVIYFIIQDNELKKKMINAPVGLLSKIMLVTVILCKSGNGIVIMVIGIIGRILTNRNLGKVFLLTLILSIPFYISARTMGDWDGQSLVELVGEVSDSERAGSLRIRMVQEDLFTEKADERWLLGWGGWGRAFPVDEFGFRLTRGVDAMWIIVYGENGIIGLVSMYLVLLLGPYLVAMKVTKNHYFNNSERNILYLTSTIPVMFAIDALFNAMFSPLYLLISAALISNYITSKKKSSST